MSEWIDGAVELPDLPYRYNAEGKQLWAQRKGSDIPKVIVAALDNWEDYMWKTEPMPEPYVPPVPETVLPWNGKELTIGKWQVDYDFSILSVSLQEGVVSAPYQAEAELRNLAVELNKAFKIGWVRHE